MGGDTGGYGKRERASEQASAAWLQLRIHPPDLYIQSLNENALGT